MLKGKNILLGITGGIAAYKAAILVRELKKRGCDVKVVMTRSAKEFITPLTLATLSQNPILVEFFNPEDGEWNSHVKLGLWADAFIIAPATANTLAKMASGVADNLLVTSYLSARGPIFVAPTMDLDMYAHPTTARNLEQLRSDGVHIMEPDSGFLASGLEGKGRMAEPVDIADFVEHYFTAAKPLQGRRAVVSAGGTIEPIDSVRFISNYSSGKMGYAIAAALQEQGAEVTIVRAGVDSKLKGSLAGVTELEAMSAQQMYEAMEQCVKGSDIIVMAAAVADYTPECVAERKLKKSDFKGELSLALKQTKDIAAMIGATKRDDQIFIGFALETDDELANAQKKLEAKRFDYIVLNSLNDKGAGFGVDTNKVTILSSHSEPQSIALKPKKELAYDIVNLVIRD